jgi:hypothetical protein
LPFGDEEEEDEPQFESNIQLSDNEEEHFKK